MYYKNQLIIEKLSLAKIQLLKEIICDLKHLIVKVSGESMLPTLMANEKIAIDPINKAEDLQNGDIILFYDVNYNLALHRLIREGGNKFILQGDNAETLDIIEFENIIGRLNSNIPLNSISCESKKKYLKHVDDYVITITINFGELVSSNLYSQKEYNDGKCYIY